MENLNNPQLERGHFPPGSSSVASLGGRDFFHTSRHFKPCHYSYEQAQEHLTENIFFYKLLEAVRNTSCPRTGCRVVGTAEQIRRYCVRSAVGVLNPRWGAYHTHRTLMTLK